MRFLEARGDESQLRRAVVDDETRIGRNSTGLSMSTRRNTTQRFFCRVTRCYYSCRIHLHVSCLLRPAYLWLSEAFHASSRYGANRVLAFGDIDGWLGSQCSSMGVSGRCTWWPHIPLFAVWSDMSRLRWVWGTLRLPGSYPFSDNAAIRVIGNYLITSLPYAYYHYAATVYINHLIRSNSILEGLPVSQGNLKRIHHGPVFRCLPSTSDPMSARTNRRFIAHCHIYRSLYDVGMSQSEGSCMCWLGSA